MKKYEKMYKAITDKIRLKEYNRWFNRIDWSRLSQDDTYLVYTGIRLLGKLEAERYPNEKLPNTTKKEFKHYSNL